MSRVHYAFDKNLAAKVANENRSGSSRKRHAARDYGTTSLWRAFGRPYICLPLALAPHCWA
jgi:hypothetical protein